MEFINLKESFGRCHRVYFELSRKCPSIHEHPACPIAELKKEFDGFLDTDIILDFVKQLVKYESPCDISFHIYNEPTIDCRLLYLIHKIKHHLGFKNKMALRTSGWGLDKHVFKELTDMGLDWIMLDAYNEKSYNEMRAVKNEFQKSDVAIQIKKLILDNRLTMYQNRVRTLDDWVKDNDIEFYCIEAIKTFNVSANGEVNLCEWDWRNTVIFGNLNKDSYETVFRNKIEFFNKTKEGTRFGAEVCAKCEYLRGFKPTHKSSV